MDREEALQAKTEVEHQKELARLARQLSYEASKKYPSPTRMQKLKDELARLKAFRVEEK